MLPKFMHLRDHPGYEPPPPVTLSQQDFWLAFGLAGLVALLGAWLMVVGVCGVHHDDAIYVITAKALAQGQGYRLIDLPNAPLQTKYPILYPALLAIIWKIWPSFPANLLAMQGLSLLAGAATVALAYLFLVRFAYATRGVALLSGLFCATSAIFLHFSTLTMSEAPYALLSILALWGLEKQRRCPTAKPGRQIALGLLLALPFLTRAIGLVLIPAGLAGLYLARRRVRWISLGAALLAVPWILWMLLGPRWSPHPVNPYYTNYEHWWSSYGMLNLAKIFFFNIFYTTVDIVMICFGLVDHFLKHNGTIIIILIAILLLTLSAILNDIKHKNLLGLYLSAYLGLIWIWPWPPDRFLIPILPFLLVFLFKEGWKVIQKSKIISERRYLLALCLIVLLGFNVQQVYQVGRMARAIHYPLLTEMPEPISWSSYQEVFHWVNTHTTSADTLAAGLDSMLYLYTGRRAWRPFMMNPMALFYSQNGPAWTRRDFLHSLKFAQPQYLILTPMPWYNEEKPFAEVVKETIQKYPGLFKTVYVGQDKRFIIYRLQAEGLAARNN
jgi:4-amino-4-deoxy-L-arabinose transferase-like glycosyltransferase